MLVCCVGLWDNQAKMKRLPKEKLDAAFEEIFAINVKSYILATKVCMDALVESEGNIVYTLSNSAFYPDGGGPLYMATKFAVRGLLVEMAYELAPKVRVNGVAPGGTATLIGGLKSLEQEPMLGTEEMREGAEIHKPSPASLRRRRPCRRLPLPGRREPLSRRDRRDHQLRRRPGLARLLQDSRPAVSGEWGVGSRAGSAHGSGVGRSPDAWGPV